MATITCSPLQMNDEIDDAINDAVTTIVDAFFDQNDIPNPTDEDVDDGSDDTYYELKDAVRGKILSAIASVEFPDEVEVEDEDAYSLIDKLGFDESMTCDQIFDKVYDHIRELYDGQVSDFLISDEVESTTEEICGYFGIEYHRQEWT